MDKPFKSVLHGQCYTRQMMPTSEIMQTKTDSNTSLTNGSTNRLNVPAKCKTVAWTVTVDGRFAGEHDDDQLQAGVGVFEVAEHRLHLVSTRGVLTEAWLTEDRHSCI